MRRLRVLVESNWWHEIQKFNFDSVLPRDRSTSLHTGHSSRQPTVRQSSCDVTVTSRISRGIPPRRRRPPQTVMADDDDDDDCNSESGIKKIVAAETCCSNNNNNTVSTTKNTLLMTSEKETTSLLLNCKPVLAEVTQVSRSSALQC